MVAYVLPANSTFLIDKRLSQYSVEVTESLLERFEAFKRFGVPRPSDLVACPSQVMQEQDVSLFGGGDKECIQHYLESRPFVRVFVRIIPDICQSEFLVLKERTKIIINGWDGDKLVFKIAVPSSNAIVLLEKYIGLPDEVLFTGGCCPVKVTETMWSLIRQWLPKVELPQQITVEPEPL